MDKNLSIVVVESDHDRGREIVEGLTAIGYSDILVIADTAKLSSKVVAAQADVVLIDMADPSRDVLEELAVASDPLNRPVALFVDEDKEGLAKAAIESGISAYVVNGLSADRLRPVLDTAIARFNMVGRMRTELAQAKRALEERKVIDRAKGLLMKARGIDEEAAYALLRRTAMDQGRKVIDVAQALVTAADLLS